jgi:hypothetical protein
MVSGELEALMDEYNRLLWSIAGGILRGVGTSEDIEECVSDGGLDTVGEEHDARRARRP